jgi:DNA invertase Pin-like site-specific DNA recombinase
MTTSTLDLSGNGAAYLRVSDDKQEIATQRRSIADWEKRHGVQLSRSFEDEGWSRDEHDRRPDWLEMLSAIDRGEIQWLVVESKDRFGTASGRKKVVYYDRLWEAGCKLYTTGDVLLNEPSLTSTITAVVDGDTEERELRVKSERAVNKMRQTAEAGKWTGGPIPIGLDVVCMTLDGRERWRVVSEGHQLRIKVTPQGDQQRYDGADNFPARDATDWLTLRPSLDTNRLQAVRDVYEWYDLETITVFAIARRLNDQKRPCPASVTGKWEAHHVSYMLANPVYMGVPAYNKISQGKWNAWRDGRRIEHADPFRRNTTNDRKDWVQPPRQFDGIVSDERWERVYEKFSKRTKQPHAPKSGGLWLSGLLVCDGCGLKMFGAKRRRGEGVYWCKSAVKKIKGCTCKLNTLPHAEIETYLRQYITEANDILDQIDAPELQKSQAEMDRFRTGVERAMTAYYKMHQTVSAPQDEGTLRIITPPWATETDDVAVSYRKLFDARHPRLQAELDQLETAHTRLTLAWSELPTQRAKEKARIRLAELETEMTDIEKQLTNHADDWADALSTVRRLQSDWQRMATMVGSDINGRQKTAAARKIIQEIRCKFVPTGLHRPTARLVEVRFVPKIGEPELVNSEALAFRYWRTTPRRPRQRWGGSWRSNATATR